MAKISLGDVSILKLRIAIDNAMRSCDQSCGLDINSHVNESVKKQTKFNFDVKPFVPGEHQLAELPVYSYREKIIETVATNQITIINGGTGKY